jgi:hypothetical protein
MTSRLNKTRASLFYLAFYLGSTGVALLFAPDFTLRLLGAHREYDPVFVRFTGSFMMALSGIVTQMIRLRVDALYPTTIAVRAFFIACIAWFYVQTGDSVFFVFLGVVALGFVLTSVSLILDRRRV